MDLLPCGQTLLRHSSATSSILPHLHLPSFSIKLGKESYLSFSLCSTASPSPHVCWGLGCGWWKRTPSFSSWDVLASILRFAFIYLFFFQINCHLSLVAWPFLGFFSVLASPSPVTHLVSSDLILQPVFLFSLAWTWLPHSWVPCCACQSCQCA